MGGVVRVAVGVVVGVARILGGVRGAVGCSVADVVRGCR